MSEVQIHVFLTLIGSELLYAELVKTMEEYLNQKPSVVAKNRVRIQTPGESIKEFIADFPKIADNCKFENHLEESLRLLML